MKKLIYILIIVNLGIFIYGIIHTIEQKVSVDIKPQNKISKKAVANEVTFPIAIISHKNSENKNVELIRAFVEENNVDGFIMPKDENLTSRFKTIMPILVYLEIEGIRIKYYERLDNRYLRNINHETLIRIKEDGENN